MESGLFFHLYVGPGDWTQVTRLAQAPFLSEPQTHFDVVSHAIPFIESEANSTSNCLLCFLT